MSVYRQGDVLLKKIAGFSKKAKPLSHRILAEGEVTGHRHQVTEGIATLFEYEGTLFLRVESEMAMLTHEASLSYIAAWEFSSHHCTRVYS